MSEKIDGRHSNPGRPEKPIDWNKVDQLLIAGCKGTEIAPHFDMHVNTFYDKILEKYKMNFTEYCALKRDQGDSLLKAKQFEKAIKGDNTLLIWLGKVRLGQKEIENNQQIPTEVLERFEAFAGIVSRAQSDRKIADNNTKVEDQS